MPDERMWLMSIWMEGGSIVEIASHDLSDFDHVIQEWTDVTLSSEHVIDIEGVKGFDRAPQRTLVRKDKIISLTVVRY